MLGVYFCPTGEGGNHVTSMTANGEGWLDRLQAKPLPTKDAWLSFFMQLYPGMSWGLPTVIMPPNKIEQEFQRLYYKCLPKLGVNWCITREWRMLSLRYLGFGMPNMAVNFLARNMFFYSEHLGLSGNRGRDNETGI